MFGSFKDLDDDESDLSAGEDLTTDENDNYVDAELQPNIELSDVGEPVDNDAELTPDTQNMSEDTIEDSMQDDSFSDEEKQSDFTEQTDIDDERDSTLSELGSNLADEQSQDVNENVEDNAQDDEVSLSYDNQIDNIDMEDSDFVDDVLADMLRDEVSEDIIDDDYTLTDTSEFESAEAFSNTEDGITEVESASEYGERLDLGISEQESDLQNDSPLSDSDLDEELFGDIEQMSNLDNTDLEYEWGLLDEQDGTILPNAEAIGENDAMDMLNDLDAEVMIPTMDSEEES